MTAAGWRSSRRREASRTYGIHTGISSWMTQGATAPPPILFKGFIGALWKSCVNWKNKNRNQLVYESFHDNRDNNDNIDAG